MPWNEFCMIRVIWEVSDGFSREVWSSSLPSDQDLTGGGSPPPKIEKNKLVLKWSLGNFKCFKLTFFFFKKNWTNLTRLRSIVISLGLFLFNITCRFISQFFKFPNIWPRKIFLKKCIHKVLRIGVVAVEIYSVSWIGQLLLGQMMPEQVLLIFLPSPKSDFLA